MFDNRPFAAYHRAELIVFARSVLLKIAASHHNDSMPFIFIRLFISQVEAIDFGVPIVKEKAPEAFGFPDHNIIAAIAPLLAFAFLYIRWGDENPGQFLHGNIEKDKGEAKGPNGPADPTRSFLARDAFFRQGGLLFLIA